MTEIKDKFMEAVAAKKNDTKSFIWKYAKNSDGTQPEIRLVDATPEQLQQFYTHCYSMLYNEDKLNPGRYTLLNIIGEQRRKCNVELFLRKLETGELCADHKPYPRYLYIQDIRRYMNQNKDQFPSDQLKEISIAAVTNNLPREFERITIDEVLDAGLGQLGTFDNKHITFSFIIGLGIYLAPDELRELDQKDKDGKTRSKMEVLKEQLGIPAKVCLTVKSGGLNYREFRALVNLKKKNYSELTTDQLTVLRNKVLFRLENEVQFHINQWETKRHEIELVAKEKGIALQ